MTLPTNEIELAQAVLRALSPAQGAEARIYRNITAPNRRRAPWGSRWALAFAVFFGGSSAFALGRLGWAIYPTVAVSLGLAPAQTSVSASPLPRKAPPCNVAVSQSAKVRAARAQVPFDLNAGVDMSTSNENNTVNAGRENVAEASDVKRAAARSMSGLRNPEAGSKAGSVGGSLLSQASRDERTTTADAGKVSELRLQVTEYQQAAQSISSEPSRALSELLEFRRKWPRSAILPEVEFRVIQALTVLGRTEDARREAAQFIARHPDNVNNGQLRQLVGGPSDEPLEIH